MTSRSVMSGEWIRVPQAWPATMVTILIPREYENDIFDMKRLASEDPLSFLQNLVTQLTHEKYPGTQCVGIHMRPEINCWVLVCVHHAFPRTPPAERLPEWRLTREGDTEKIPSYMLDESPWAQKEKRKDG